MSISMFFSGLIKRITCYEEAERKCNERSDELVGRSPGRSWPGRISTRRKISRLNGDGLGRNGGYWVGKTGLDDGDEASTGKKKTPWTNKGEQARRNKLAESNEPIGW